MHKRFCKFVLGVPTTAVNLAVYGELGRIPLVTRRKSAYQLTKLPYGLGDGQVNSSNLLQFTGA